MKTLPNPQLPFEDWDTYRVYEEVDYDPAEWNSRHWVCPLCDSKNSVLKNSCHACARVKVKKVIGHNRLGNPVERWVMRR